LQLRDIFVFKQTGLDADGKVLGEYHPTGYIPRCYEELATRGLPIKEEMFQPKGENK